MSNFISNFSFTFALILSIGSLAFYLSSAIWSRRDKSEGGDQLYDFNLGTPETQDAENTFALSLVSAGTSLSTVFVFFLTAGSIYGLWLILSPLMFAIGNWLMFRIYEKIKSNGYFEVNNQKMSIANGLLPYLGYTLTSNRKVGWLIAFFSLFNLFSILVLELVVGVEVLGYLSKNSFHNEAFSLMEFLIFGIAVLLLISYVLIGGFKAVISSDLWQIKAMKWAIALTIVSVIIFGFSSKPSTSEFHVLIKSPPWLILWGFILNVILANLFAPLSQEASWQRFRAFDQKKEMKLSKSLGLSVSNALILWFGLIIISFSLFIILPSDTSANLSSMSLVLESIRTINDWWFPLFVFPILSVAALSAMFSTADTSIAALLYLLEYSVLTKNDETVSYKNSVPKKYYLAGGIIFLFSIGVYFFVRIWFKPTILQLVFSVFSNLVVIAPTIICVAILKPFNIVTTEINRVPYIMTSLILGFIAYWSCSVTAIVLGGNYLWLSQLSIAIGLVIASVPILFLFGQHSKQNR